MVSSVTSSPYFTYLNQLQGAGSTSAATGSTTGASSASGSSATATAQSLVSSLLNGGNSFSSEALSLLQPDSSGSFDPITTLLGGTGTNDGLTSLYANLYDSSAAATLTQAQENSGTNTPVTTTGSSGSGASTTNNTPTDPVFALINAQTQASIAYNQTLQQNTATAVQQIVQA